MMRWNRSWLRRAHRMSRPQQSFVGMTVRADGKEARLADGRAEWTLDVPVNAARTTIEIRDQNGNTVATRSGALSAGRQTFSWDGATSSGQFAPDGRYTINIDARDGSGQPISVNTEVEGVVDALDLEGQEPVLLIGDARVPLSADQGRHALRGEILFNKRLKSTSVDLGNS